FPGAWRRCNSLEWNDHSASLRLALHPENRTLQPVQRRFLGSIASSAILQTVLQFRSVIGTPSNFSEAAASLDLPTPSGAWR
ncbi:MAG: hypothetical protein WC091_20075, partial [Sulfuricellaceae bacterium]